MTLRHVPLHALVACLVAAPAVAARADGRADAPRTRSADGFDVEGMVGTLGSDEVEFALAARSDDLASCVGGIVESSFVALTVRLDARGAVRWVYARESSLAHRRAERCLESVVRETAFPAPRGGGEAEFRWSFGLDGAAPRVVDASRIGGLIEAHGARLAAECAAIADARCHVTARIDASGGLTRAGVACDRPVASTTLDCIAAGVTRWRTRGVGPARVTFELPAPLAPGLASASPAASDRTATRVDPR